MNKFTVNKVMKLDPCVSYTREIVKELWGKKRSLSLREILNLEIPAIDKAWVLARLVPLNTAVKWAWYCASTNIHSTNSTAHADWAQYWAAEGENAEAAENAANAAEEAAGNSDSTLEELLNKLIEMTEKEEN